MLCRGYIKTDQNMPSNGLTLNLGSGRDWRDDCVNMDINEKKNPDWHGDICTIEWGQKIQTHSGEITVGPGIFTKILAQDVLEHVPDLVKCMRNCLDLLDVGGEMHIHVPHELSLGAWQDPTHVRAFNENSWVYYCAWHWYLDWQDFRFEMKHLEFRLSKYGESLELEQDELLRTPRAVDSMYVVLRKIPV